MKKQQGFTLIELIVVLVILGILAATALPRFTNLGDEARIASVHGMAGALRSAVAITKAQYFATGNMSATTVNVGGTNVTVAAGTGIPAGSAAGIGAALESFEGFTVNYADPTAVTFTPDNGGSATCLATYNGTTGEVTTDTSGC